ncbi:MAG TPA: SEC-C metal-binding domain-containing protein, partial [Tepidisphaeraceae bacterium]|nr:SEC-C metal-binding domain-containing protein [Tepidisphaeraceae bacterium]
LDELDEPARALLVGAIARTPGGPERATAALGDYDPDAEAFDWTDVFCFDVIEEARYAPALDAVIGRLRTVPEDDDAVHEACARIIPLIGGASTVGPLAALAREAPWHAGLHATEALGRIKAPEAERALLELIGSGEAAEKEVDDAAYAALEALIPTGEGFDLLYGQARDGPSDPMWGDLRYSCVVVAEMTGRTLPESKQWRRHVDKIVAEDKRTRHLLTQPSEATLAAWRRRLDGLPEDVGDEEDDDFEDEEADEEFGLDSPVPELPDAVSAYLPPVAQTIRRDAPKVGRNDPCPCGSGKKYKKCCGGK